MAVVTAPGDILKLVVHGFWEVQPELNTIFYAEVLSSAIVGGGSATVENFAAGLWFTLLDAGLLTITSTHVVYDMVKGFVLDPVTGLFGAAEDFVIPGDLGAGTVATDALPPNQGYKLRLNRPGGTFRHNYKSFSGVPETMQVDGFINGAAATVLPAVATLLAGSIQAQTFADPDFTNLVGTSMEIRNIQTVLDGDILPVPRFARPSTIVALGQVRNQESRAYGRGS